MPPKAKIDRQMILNAALKVIREQGHAQMNVRSIAQVLGCSTQPVLYHFKTIEEIRLEAYRMADALHSDFLTPKGEGNPLLELGLNYIRFGYEEKNLFRFLFQTNGLGGRSMGNLISDPAAAELIGMVSAVMQCSTEDARAAFFQLFVTAHGIASLLANNAMEYEEETFRTVLENACRHLRRDTEQ